MKNIDTYINTISSIKSKINVVRDPVLLHCLLSLHLGFIKSLDFNSITFNRLVKNLTEGFKFK